MHGATNLGTIRVPFAASTASAGLDRRAGWAAPRLACASRPTAGKQPASQRILVIRSTCRIGNNLFLLPFLHQLRRAPYAELELVCSGGQLLPFLADLQLQRIHQSGCRAAAAGPCRCCGVCAVSTTIGSTCPLPPAPIT
jgi:hypothetical protein